MRTNKKVLVSSIAALGIAVSTTFPVAAQSGNNSQCLDGSKASSYVASFTRGTGTISTKDGKAICSDSKVVLESFTLPSTWNGKGFNSTALPQTKFAIVDVAVPAGQKNWKKTVNVDVPDNCKSTQLDFYLNEGYDKLVGLHDDDARYIYGVIFKGHGTCQTTPPTTPEEPETPTTPETPETPETPTTPEPPVTTPEGTPKNPVVTPPAELPKTGMGNLVLPFGIATVLGTAVAAIKRR